MSTAPSGLVSPDTPSGSPAAPEASTPLPGPLTPSPPLPHPPLHPYHHSNSLGTCYCSLNENVPFYCRGTEHEILGYLPLPYIPGGLLDVGTRYSPI